MHLIAANVWLLTPANWWIVFQVAAGLGFVIFVHELGHFLVAKACGVKCEKFYLGFDIGGLKLLKFKWGETEYGIGILPLGGYVKMLGQDDNPARRVEEDRRARAAAASDSSEPPPVLTHGDLPPEPVSDPHAPYDPRSYMAQSVPKRMAIISAGVVMNVIFAFIMATVAYQIGVMETPCIVQGVVPGGAAWKAGLQPGDIVRQIGETKDPWYRDLRIGVTLGDIQEGIRFEIERDGTTFPVTLKPDSKLGVPMIGIIGPSTLKLDDPPTVPHSPANRSQPEFKAGDLIARLDQTPVETATDLTRLLTQKRNQAVEVFVQRPVNLEQGPAAGAAEDELPPPEEIATRVEPTPVKDLGLVMKMGPIAAVQDDSPAAKAGIQPGDRLLLINGQRVGNPLTLPQRMRSAAAAGQPIRLVVERGAEGQAHKVSVEATPRPDDLGGDEIVPVGPMSVPELGIAYEVPATVEGVLPGTPPAKEGVKPGDVVLKATTVPPPPEDKRRAGDRPVEEPITIRFGDKDPAWPYLIFRVLPFVDPASTVKLELQSGKERREVVLRPIEFKDETGALIYSAERGFVFAPLEVLREVESLGEAIKLGGRETLEKLSMVYRILQKIGKQEISARLLGGPVEIFRQAGYSAEEGLSKLLLFLTMLSANLAVINFLPIPVLDGGHMVFLLYELIRGKPASERVIIAFTYLGLLFILTLMLFVLALDVGIIARR